MLRATLKSLLARKLRLILSALAVVLGVMFVSGAFVLTDTLGRSFDNVFADAYEGIDVKVAAQAEVGDGETRATQVAGHVPAATVARVAGGRRGRRGAPAWSSPTGPGCRQERQGGQLVRPGSSAANWHGESDLVKLRAGRAPRRTTRSSSTTGSPRRARCKVGDPIGVITRGAASKTFTIAGVMLQRRPGLDRRRQRGAVHRADRAAADARRAGRVQPHRRQGGRRVSRRPAARRRGGRARRRLRGADRRGTVGGRPASLKEGLPTSTTSCSASPRVALLVGIFLILNTFSIIVAQRTQELALMRAMGASRGQIIRSVLIEARRIGLVGSLLGLVAGIGLGALRRTFRQPRPAGWTRPGWACRSRRRSSRSRSAS